MHAGAFENRYHSDAVKVFTKAHAVTGYFAKAMAMTEYMQVLTTVDSADEAERLGRSITSARLAACVQIVGPIRFLFWWQDKLDDA
jgi:hypothetical protein